MKQNLVKLENYFRKNASIKEQENGVIHMASIALESPRSVSTVARMMGTLTRVNVRQ